MFDSSIEKVMPLLEPYLDMFDEILRSGHKQYLSYPVAVRIDHDASTQAHCTYRHILALALSKFDYVDDCRHFEVNGQNLWLFEQPNVIIRFKKTDENGKSQNYPTKQAKAFDVGLELPGLPPVAKLLTAGYFLDPTGLEYIRTQISRPVGKDIDWCAAVVSAEFRVESEPIWLDVTKQPKFAS